MGACVQKAEKAYWDFWILPRRVSQGAIDQAAMLRQTLLINRVDVWQPRGAANAEWRQRNTSRER